MEGVTREGAGRGNGKERAAAVNASDSNARSTGCVLDGCAATAVVEPPGWTPRAMAIASHSMRQIRDTSRFGAAREAAGCSLWDLPIQEVRCAALCPYLRLTASSTSSPCSGSALLPPAQDAALALRATGTPLLNSAVDRSWRERSNGVETSTPWTSAPEGTITGLSTCTQAARVPTMQRGGRERPSKTFLKEWCLSLTSPSQTTRTTVLHASWGRGRCNSFQRLYAPP